MRSIGINELLIIFAIGIFLFGGRKLPELAKGLGDSIRNFKHAVRESEDAAKAASEKGGA